MSSWNVVLWNDPVNLMDYVVWVLRSVLGRSAEEARRMMLAAHQSGRVVVDGGSREHAEMQALRLRNHSLRVTLEAA
jgi:ATP-dependent Clp protease adaptor protein ClpS